MPDSALALRHATIPGTRGRGPSLATGLCLLGGQGGRVIKFTENLAAEADHAGVQVFSVHPGLIPIGLTERALADGAAPGSAKARVHAWIRTELPGRPQRRSRAGRPRSSPGSPQATPTGSAAATCPSTTTWTPFWPARTTTAPAISYAAGGRGRHSPRADCTAMIPPGSRYGFALARATNSCAWPH